MSLPTCRLCGHELKKTFVDLGLSPPCEYFPTAEQIDQGETFYPLNVRICEECLLVQLPAYIDAEENFSYYAYFSSFSDTWVKHSKTHVDTAVERLGLDRDSFVVEAASNDGYLLQHVKDRGIRCLGIEPAANVAQAAIDKGIPTTVQFLGEETGKTLRNEHGPADLVVANNVFAHVPNIVDFTKGLRALLKPDGYVTIEIPHLQKLIENRYYDTIYHEHFSYVTLLTTMKVLEKAGLKVVDVDVLRSHGGSLRTWSTPVENNVEISDSVEHVLSSERDAGMHELSGYEGFANVVSQARNDVLEFLIKCSREGKTVAGYGAPGKGNTLLNHCGIRSDLISYVVDRNPFKHYKFLPGSHIPIFPTDKLEETKPDVIVILPWNLRDEISKQLEYTAEWGAQLMVPLPRAEVIRP